MRIRTKLLFLFLASGVFLILQAVVAAFSLEVVGRDVASLHRYTQTDDMAGQVKAELAQLPTPEEIAREPGKARMSLLLHADRTLVLLRSLERLTATPRSREALTRIRAAVEDYRSAGRAFARALEERSRGQGERSAAERAHEALEEVLGRGGVEPVGQEARLAIQAVVRRAETFTTWWTAGGLSLALLLTVGAAVFLARATAQPIVRLLRAARAVGEGDLSQSVEERGDDELAELTRAFNDMTQRLRAIHDGLEAEVRKRTDELRQREQDLERERRLAAIGRLAAGVAHEVSSPLTVIASAAEGLRDRARDPGLQAAPGFEDFPDYLETIEQEAYRLKRLVRRLLDFSRTRPAVAEVFDLAPVLGDAISLARLDPRAREHPIQDELAGPLPVRGDPDALKEAALNLLFNALAAVADGGDVTVRGQQHEGRVVVEVSDTGVGVEPQDLDRLFEPFFTTRRAGEGTGLGLSLVYGTVDRHGGTITARSDGPGKGATFRVELPAAAGQT